MDDNFTKTAKAILEQIKSAHRILLHCHPSPDPDSVGSALAMKFALEGLGKKVTLIKGDSEIPLGFRHFPGAGEIANKNFSEIEIKDFDLFVILDSAAPEQISRYKTPHFPLEIPSIVIDHHPTNKGFADLNLVVPECPATSQILFEIMKIWNTSIDEQIAANLFLGIYSDTGFRYSGVSKRTFEIAGELWQKVPNMPEIIAKLENSFTPEYIRFQALALSNVETLFANKVAISSLSAEQIREAQIPVPEVRASFVSVMLNSVADWQVSAVLFEAEPGKVRVSFRTHDAGKYDVSKLAAAIGGGGHKAASGAILAMNVAEAKDLVVSKMKELYNL